MENVNLAKLLVALLPFIVVAIIGTICGVYYFVRHCKTIHARKKQYVMFGSLKKGDYIWKLVGRDITEYIVNSIGYTFDKNNKIVSMRIYMNKYYHSITISPSTFKSFKYIDGNEEYYTLYEEASTKRDFVNIVRNSEINKSTSTTENDFICEHERIKRELEKMAEETTERIKVKLNK